MEISFDCVLHSKRQLGSRWLFTEMLADHEDIDTLEITSQ